MRVRARRPRRAARALARASSTCSPPPTCRTTPSRSFPTCATSRCSPTASSRFRGEAVLALVGDAEALLGDRRGRAADPLRAAAGARRHRRRARRRRGAASRCMRAIPTTCCAAAASSRGDVDAALADAAVARRRARRFETRYVEHAYIEPEAGYAEIVEARRRRRAAAPRPHLRLHPDALHGPRRDRAACSAIAPEQVHIVPSAIGGGFGGKLDLSVQPLLAVAAWKLGRAGAPGLRAAGVDAVEHQAPSGADARDAPPATRDGTLAAVRLQRRLQHRRLFVVGADGRQPGADPRQRPVPRAARARADARRATRTTASPARSAASACRSRRCSASC